MLCLKHKPCTLSELLSPKLAIQLRLQQVALTMVRARKGVRVLLTASSEAGMYRISRSIGEGTCNIEGGGGISWVMLTSTRTSDLKVPT
jgi:hypothetical protein